LYLHSFHVAMISHIYSASLSNLTTSPPHTLLYHLSPLPFNPKNGGFYLISFSTYSIILGQESQYRKSEQVASWNPECLYMLARSCLYEMTLFPFSPQYYAHQPYCFFWIPELNIMAPWWTSLALCIPNFVKIIQSLRSFHGAHIDTETHIQCGTSHAWAY
jgi:hypothetical protein